MNLNTIINKYTKKYLSIFIFSAIISFLMLIPGWYSMQVYDRVLTSHDITTLLGLLLIATFLYIINGLIERYRGLLLIEVSEKLETDLSPIIYNNIVTPNQHNQNDKGNYVNDLNVIKQFLSGHVIISILDAPWIFISLGLIFIIHYDLGLLALGSCFILIFLVFLTQKLTSKQLEESQELSLTERRLVNNATASAESLFALGMRNNLQQMIGNIRKESVIKQLVASSRAVEITSITKFFKTLIQALILALGVYLVLQNEITMGMIFATNLLLGKTLSPLEGIINSWKQVAEFKKSFSSIKVLADNQKIQMFSVELGKPKGFFNIKELSLLLNKNGKPTLKNINLTINPGCTTAIIGPSGAGKTSLLKLLSGIYQASEGFVYLDNSDITKRDFNDLGKYFGYLSQTTDLLAGKVSENIARFGEVNSEMVIEAAQLAGVHEMIMSLPEAYETVLGDNGFGLSEGQKRKIGLARALYGNPNIIFLDEPGAGLDDISLNVLVDSLKALKNKNATIILTTHQSKLISLSDNLIVIGNSELKLYGSTINVINQLKNS